MFIGAKMFGGPVEFVLAGSGHIAGVVNPPDKVKYQYWTAPKAAAETLEEWMSDGQGAPGLLVAALGRLARPPLRQLDLPREPGEKLGAIEAAPGSYVKAKS